MKLQKLFIKHKYTFVLISGVLIILGFIFKFSFVWDLGYSLAMITASIIGSPSIVIQAYQALKVKIISIELLVSIAVTGAFIIGEFSESAIVIFLFLFGGLLEQKTLEKTRSAIRELIKMAPASALRIDKAAIEEIPIDEVNKGDLLLVKTGAQIPVDGVIQEGGGYINEASVTGEPGVAGKAVGEKVFAGTIVENGTLKIEAEKIGEDTTFGKIIELVEEAQDNKSEAERFIDRFAKYYTPIVLLLALIVGLVFQNIHLAITVLILGCPGALVIGVPVSNVAGIGNGAKNGILIKSGELMTAFSKADTMIFDKTGTLTNGKPAVSEVKAYTDDIQEALRLTASVERESEHPLGQAILDYVRETSYAKINKTEVVKGQGIIAHTDVQKIIIGSQTLMENHAVLINSQAEQDLLRLQQSGNSTVFVAINNQLALLIGMKDQVRPDAKRTLQILKQMGIKHFVMLTGDNQTTAEMVGNELGIMEIHGDFLPEDKSSFMKQLQDKGKTVAFVGDGVNDSPSIALADVGIAMGNGTDVAVETSDIVLIHSNFKKLIHAFGVTKKTVANMKENIIIAVGTVIFLLIGLVFGYIYMAGGMLVHELSILAVVINGMRLLRYRTKYEKLDSCQVLNEKLEVQ
ncbi:heavy metal translocating P-type ATPase [Oceanobacillus sojae]|uniref:heavy metal translocating P-type ATPase n=1 Tax=Oceanobacillus sojae TaxID=582851 RepID=UPI0009886C13|nr:heavy metal translocating P-type ATPase [Oceanobacillus sojae]MCT1904503.1 heavy metal translocating P-type ATPase [Oceanobacillus sojae]